jgi:ribonuclease HI
MKKKAQASLKQLKTIFNKAELMNSEIEKLFETLKDKILTLPEEIKHDLEVLPPPSELKDFPNGLAFYCDGACRTNPGPGGWGIVAQNAKGDLLFEDKGFEPQSTNNRMELQGCIELLERLMSLTNKSQYSPIMIMTDSKYVVDGMTSWVDGWKRRGWKKADGKEPENIDLWKQLDLLKSDSPEFRLYWVKGHVGHPQNERCDQLANIAIDENLNT